MRTIVAHVALVVLTAVFGTAGLILAALGFPDDPGTLADRCRRWWVRGLLWASGVTVVGHGAEPGASGRAVVEAGAGVRDLGFVQRAALQSAAFLGSVVGVAG